MTFSSDNPTFASVNGSALYFNSPGSATIRAAQAGNDNYLPAFVDRLSSVTLPSFESLFGGQTANSDANGDGVPALAEYALGGSTNSNNLGILPSLSTNTNRLFTLTAIVRTNDPKLSILPGQRRGASGLLGVGRGYGLQAAG